MSESDLQDENAYEAIKYWRDILAFLLEDAVEAFLQFNFVDRYVLRMNWVVTINSVIMFIISIATLVRFLVYVCRYWKLLESGKDKFMLSYMVMIILSISLGNG